MLLLIHVSTLVPKISITSEGLLPSSEDPLIPATRIHKRHTDVVVALSNSLFGSFSENHSRYRPHLAQRREMLRAVDVLGVRDKNLPVLDRSLRILWVQTAKQ